MENLIKTITSDTKLVFLDLDKTACNGNVNQAIGEGFLRELKRDSQEYKNGMKELKTISTYVDENRDSQAMGLKMFYNALVANNIGTEKAMYGFAMDHLNAQKVPEVANLLEKLSAYDIPIVLVTASGSTAAKAAKEVFKIKYSLSNIDLFTPDGKLAGVNMVITNGEDKLSVAKEFALDKFGVSIEDCTMIGDSPEIDGPLMKRTKLAIASPLACGSLNEIRKDLIRLRK